MKRKLLFALGGLIALAFAAIYYAVVDHVHELVLTGIVTTDDVIVSSEIQGRLQRLSIKQGDVVKRGELLGLIAPQEWKADTAYYENSERSAAAQVAQAEADFKYQETLTTDQIKQAEANLASTQALAVQAEADLENADLTFKREYKLRQKGVESAQAYDQARTADEGAKAHVESLRKQVQAAQSAVDVAKANTGVVAMRRAALDASRRQLAAWTSQKEKAQVHLGYTEIRAPIDGFVDVRAALEGEVVNPGQAIVTLIDPDDLWVRADVEESYIDRVHLGDKMVVRLPSGAEREGTVFFRGVDADYATQRDVSRTKRDIKTFEVRLRCTNRDRALAVGMTVYVLFPLRK
jgi:multidrug resistance efflux pump